MTGRPIFLWVSELHTDSRSLALPGTSLVAMGFLFAANDASANDIQWDGGVTAVYQDSDDSRAESELTASADLFATLPRSNGEWFLYVEASSSPKSNGVSAFYPTVNGDARSVLTSDGGGGIQVSEFNYTFFLQDDHWLMLGLINPSAWLDLSRIANDENVDFLNGSFVHNATIEYPDYTLGGVFRRLGSLRRSEITIVVSGSDGIADLPDASYQDLLDLNSSGRGVFLGADASWFHERFTWRIGAWLRSDEHPVADDATKDEMNYGVFSVLDWQSGANSVSVRAGIANPDVSVANRFLAIAYQRDTQLGLFGIGIAQTLISEEFRASSKKHAFDSEIYFRIPLSGGTGHVSPSIQYVEVPALNPDEAIPGSSAIVAGIRFHWSF